MVQTRDAFLALLLVGCTGKVIVFFLPFQDTASTPILFVPLFYMWSRTAGSILPPPPAGTLLFSRCGGDGAATAAN